MGLIDSALNFAGDAASGLADAIGSEIFTAISNAIGWVMYQATRAAMWLLWILQELFNVFSGTTKVQYDDEYTYLIDVFFQNRTVNNVYWGIALLGVTFVIVFTIIAVIRKALT